MILWIFTGLACQTIVAQNAPASTIGIVTTYAPTATVPLRAVSFSNIGSCNLKIVYDPAVAIATSVTVGNPLLGGNLVYNVSAPGVITLGWYTWPGVTLPDNSVIFNVNFSRAGPGSTLIAFDDNGNSCKWGDGNSVNLNDIPASDFYISGSLNFLLHLAPVTMVPMLKGNPGMMIHVPVRVSNFTSIGRISLFMQYFSSALTYQSFTNNSDFPNLVIEGSIPGQVTCEGNISSGSPGIMLADSSILLTLHFTYNGGTTGMTWIDNGSSCEYTDEFFNPLPDTPFSSYYINGSVTPETTTGTGDDLTHVSYRLTVGANTLAFSLPVPGQVSITLRDIQGRVVMIPVKKETMSSGDHRKNIDTGKLTPGIYLVTLTLNANGQMLISTIKTVFNF